MKTLKKIFCRGDGSFNPTVLIVVFVALLFLHVIAVFLAFYYEPFVPTAGKEAQERLEKEFQDIKPMPQAKVCSHNSSHKSGHALVGSNYCANLGYIEIRSYYDQELAKHGWIFYEEKPIRDWSRDLGGKSARYCKGEYKISLQYAGDSASYGWTYALDLSWGLESLAERYGSEGDKYRLKGCKDSQ